MKPFFYSVLAALLGVFLGYQTRPAAPQEPKPASGTSKPLKSIAGSADTRLAERLDSLNPEQFVEMLEQFDDLPPNRRDLAICALISRWAKLDPVAAAAHVMRNEFPNKPCLIALTALAEHDIESAIAYFDASLPENVKIAVLAVLAESDPERASDLTRSNPLDGNSPPGDDPFWDLDVEPTLDEKQLWRLVGQRLSSSDPQKLPELIAGVEPNQAADILRGWQKIDPVASLALARSLISDPDFASDPNFLVSHPGLAPELTIPQLKHIANRLLNKSDLPDASLALHKRLANEIDSIRENENFAASFARAWGREDPAGGLEWTSQPGSHGRWNRLEFISVWNQHDPDAVETHLGNLPSSEELYFDVFDNWIAADDDAIVRRALDWYEAQPDEVRTEILSMFPDSTMLHDPGGVLKWVLKQKPVKRSDADDEGALFSDNGNNFNRVHFVNRALDTWLKRDEAAARLWLFQEAESGLSDRLLSQLGYTHSDYFPPIPSRHLLNENRYSVYELQARITDPELRWETLRRTMKFENESTAQRHLDASDLPAALRADLQELIDAGETNDGRYSD